MGQRRENQQDRIANGIKNGSMSAGEVARTENREQGINQQVRADRAANGGRLTGQEHRQINREQNGASRQIYRQKHNARKTPPSSNCWPGMKGTGFSPYIKSSKNRRGYSPRGEVPSNRDAPRDAARYADCMNRARIPRFAFWLCIAAAISPQAGMAQTGDQVSITPAAVVAGSPELIRVNLPAVATSDSGRPEGTWLDRNLQFFRSRDGRAWYALAGVDVQAQVGSSNLQISVPTANGATIDLSRTVEILPAHYRTGTLAVAPKFVEPGPDGLTQIKAERELKDKVFSSSAAEPLWSGDFRAPVHAAPTDSFGTRRTFNGKLASIHQGMDFRAATGTPVRAGNSGVVVLAQPLYYEGNCVVIDHGLGLFTISMHLSRIDVHEGDHVIAGQFLGLSGATGRVTGPHLHWAVQWQKAYLDPAKLLRMDLSKVH